ncbi:MAG: hypothetical protein KGV57_01805 [Fusobacterium sp.]|nr:hypothetical protein [Fusobacterium sp.]
MDNIKIKKTDEKLEIKKGVLDRKWAILFAEINAILFVVYAILSNMELNSGTILILYILFIEFIIYFTIIFIAFSSMNFYQNFYLEKISVDFQSQKLFLKSIKLNITLSLEELEEIKVYLPQNISYLRGKFQEWCTLTFITKKGEKYPWGFRLSEEKGNELKQEIEKLIKENK